MKRVLCSLLLWFASLLVLNLNDIDYAKGLIIPNTIYELWFSRQANLLHKFEDKPSMYEATLSRL